MENFDAASFLKRHWQRRHKLISGGLAVPEPVSPDILAGLALEEHVESRLITHAKGTWMLEQGPFADDHLRTLPPNNWTLLVQAVDLWLPDVAAVLAEFDFLPSFRLDDVMVSYATDGGGVGPHFDYYDVFLIQASGQRLWRVGQMCTSEDQINAEGGVKSLRSFDTTEQFTTQPGDVLYIPPRLAHWGTSIGASTTYSIGFRAPTAADLLYDLALELDARGDTRHLADPVLDPAGDQDVISEDFVAAAQALLREVAADRLLVGDWLARYMTRPKYEDLTDLSGEKRTAKFDGRLYLNGERH